MPSDMLKFLVEKIKCYIPVCNLEGQVDLKALS